MINVGGNEAHRWIFRIFSLPTRAKHVTPSNHEHLLFIVLFVVVSRGFIRILDTTADFHFERKMDFV